MAFFPYLWIWKIINTGWISWANIPFCQQSLTVHLKHCALVLSPFHGSTRPAVRNEYAFSWKYCTVCILRRGFSFLISSKPKEVRFPGQDLQSPGVKLGHLKQGYRCTGFQQGLQADPGSCLQRVSQTFTNFTVGTYRYLSSTALPWGFPHCCLQATRVHCVCV